MSLSPLQNQRGIALLYLIILFTLIGVLISSGIKKIGSQVSLGKNNDTKEAFEKTAQSIVGWTVKNGKLPAYGQYSTAFGALPSDSWGKPFIFAYYSSLTHGEDICSRTRTTISYNNQDVAFVLLSGGGDYTVDSSISSGVLAVSPLIPSVQDLIRVVTLEELKNRVGCYGSIAGRLTILNNELPNACKRRYYSATIAGDGGLSPLSYSFSGLSSIGLIRSGATVFGIPTTAKKQYPVTVTVVDRQLNAIKRSYILQLMSSCN